MDHRGAAKEDPSAHEDALLGLRGRITSRTGLISAGLVLPFCVFHGWQGRYALATLDLSKCRNSPWVRPVDSVLGEAFHRLKRYIETGKPE